MVSDGVQRGGMKLQQLETGLSAWKSSYGEWKQNGKFGGSEVRSAPTSDDPSDSYHQSSKSKTCTCCCCRQIGTMYHPFSPACRTIPLESFVVSTRSDLLLLAANSRDKWYRACSMKSEPQHRCTILRPHLPPTIWQCWAEFWATSGVQVVVAVSKSWLGPSISDTEVFLPGYSIYRSDHLRFGGGIAVYVADHPSMSPLSCGAPCGEVESLWLSISFSSLFFFAFGCMYRPPSAPFTSVSHLCSILESLLLSHKHVVACGDLNIDISDSIHPFTKSLQNFITYHSMFCPIFPTNSYLCNTLFHAWPLPHLISHSSVLNFPISDQLSIVPFIDWSVPDPPFKSITRRSLKKFDPSAFNEDLITVLWFLLNLFDDVEDKVFTFNLLFSGVLNCHAPMKTVVWRKTVHHGSLGPSGRRGTRGTSYLHDSLVQNHHLLGTSLNVRET